MTRAIDFMRKERLYILILIFVILFNIVVAIHSSGKDKAKGSKVAAASAETSLTRREDFEAALKKNEGLAILFGLATLLILGLVALGLVIDAILASTRLSKGRIDIRTCDPPSARWNLWDVSKVVLLFIFFGYILILSEAFLSIVFPIFRTDNFRMMVNSSVLDILAVVFIVYFSVIQYKEVSLKALGLSFKNFMKNVFYGIVGYLALVPILILILIITAAIINITKYVPQKQAVVELFLKEKDTAFLAYTSLFAAIVGPMIEELFFRGFMYSAFKKYIGVFWAMVVTAVFFAALHAHIVGFFPIMALGMLLAYLYEKTGTLISSATVHVIHNLSMVFLVFLVKQIGVV